MGESGTAWAGGAGVFHTWGWAGAGDGALKAGGRGGGRRGAGAWETGERTWGAWGVGLGGLGWGLGGGSGRLGRRFGDTGGGAVRVGGPEGCRRPREQEYGWSAAGAFARIRHIFLPILPGGGVSYRTVSYNTILYHIWDPWGGDAPRACTIIPTGPSTHSHPLSPTPCLLPVGHSNPTLHTLFLPHGS